MGVIKDGTRPRLASWIAWFIANAAMMLMAFTHGAHTAALFDALSAAGNAGVLVAAFIKRGGQKPEGASDWVCLAVAGSCSLVNAGFPHLAIIGTALAMFANLVATWPTMAHAWEEPFAETWQLFAANAGASLLGVIGVSATGGMKLTTVAGPLVAMVGNITLTAITLGRRYPARVTAEISAIETAVTDEVAQIEAEMVELRGRASEEAAQVAQAIGTKKPARKRTGLIGSQAGA
jgi:hypothetical protein